MYPKHKTEMFTKCPDCGTSYCYIYKCWYCELRRLEK